MRPKGLVAAPATGPLQWESKQWGHVGRPLAGGADSAGGGTRLQYPGVEPHPLHGGALGLRLRGRAQQAQRGPEVPPSVVPVPRLIGSPCWAAETVTRLRAGGGREHSWRGRRGTALAARGHGLGLDADVRVGGDREGSTHMGQGAARAGGRKWAWGGGARNRGVSDRQVRRQRQRAGERMGAGEEGEGTAASGEKMKGGR